jgi:hypothetical protein
MYTGNLFGQVFGNILAHRSDLFDEDGTYMLVDVSSLGTDVWEEIAQDIVYNLARADETIEWHVSTIGIIYILLHSKETTGAATNKIFLISCVLAHNCPHEGGSVLSIQITDNKQFQYTRQVAVTNDGIWFANPRRYCDDCNCGIASHAHLQHALQKKSQVSSPMYDRRIIFTPSWYYLRPWWNRRHTWT